MYNMLTCSNYLAEMVAPLGSFCRKCKIKQTKNPNPKPRKSTNIQKRIAMSNAARIEWVPFEHNHDRRSIEDLRKFLNTSDPAVKQLMNTAGFTANGSEQLLRLRAFDPTQDTPVELLLHTLPLGVGKCLMQFLF